MLLRSYSFNKDELTDRELELFSYMLEHPEHKCDVAYEILINALEGRIDYSKEFNLPAYEKTIKFNNLLTINTRGKKEKSYDVPISDGSDDLLKDTIAERRNLIEEYIMDDAYNRAVDFFKRNDLYMLYESVNGLIAIDLCVSLRQALKGIPEAIRNLKKVCDIDSTVREYIEVILSRGIDDEFNKYLEEVV